MTRYYYAGGRRIALEADPELVAVDEQRADAAGIRPDTDASATRRLPGGVIVTLRSTFDDAQLAALQQAGALRPVYRHDKALMVALPEIRVEVDNATQHTAVRQALAAAPHAIVISSESASSLVLAPESGQSDDALDVANYVYEAAHPAAASVRFVQFVPRPGPARR